METTRQLRRKAGQLVLPAIAVAISLARSNVTERYWSSPLFLALSAVFGAGVAVVLSLPDQKKVIVIVASAIGCDIVICLVSYSWSGLLYLAAIGSVLAACTIAIMALTYARGPHDSN